MLAGTSRRSCLRDGRDLDLVGATRIQTPDGRQVPLAAVASIQRDRGPNFVMRENVQRRIVVQSNVSAPMAIVIMFGLLSSTTLNMVVVPVLYERFGRPAAATDASARAEAVTV